MEEIRILVVEDDREIGQLIKRYLQKEGYVVEWVENGKEAFARFFSKSFHFVILDLMLPQMDGLEVLRRIRKKENVPVLILSAKGEESDKVLGLGADDYLTKPFLMGELIARVKAQLRRYLYRRKKSFKY